MLRLKQDEEENQQSRYTVPPAPVAAQAVEESTAAEAETKSHLDEEEFLAYLRASNAQNTTTLSSTPVIEATEPVSLVEWWHHLITNNPVFHKETLAQRRLQEKKQAGTRTTEKLLGGMALVGLYIGMFYLIAKIYEIPQLDGRTSAGWVMHAFLTIIEFLVVALALPLQAAMLITQEREKMTWNALLLSRVTPLQILVGKTAAALRPVLTALTMLLPAVVISAFVAQTTLKGLVVGQVVIGVTALLNASLAIYCSLFSKKSAQASGNAGGGAMLPILGFPALWGLIEAGPWIAYTMMNGGNPAGYVPPEWFHYLAAFANLFNPAVALYFGLTTAHPAFASWLWLASPVAFLTAATLTIRYLWLRMQKQFWKAPKDFSG